MDLSKLGELDSYLDHEDDFDDKTKAHIGLVASENLGMMPKDTVKPKQPFFEIVENPGDKSYVSCHLPVPVLVLSATVKKKTSITKFDTIAEEYTWAMKEAAEWCKLHLTYDEIKLKKHGISLKSCIRPRGLRLIQLFRISPHSSEVSRGEI